MMKTQRHAFHAWQSRTLHFPPQLHRAPTSQAAASHSTGKAAITPGPKPRLYLHRRFVAFLPAASTPCSPHTSNTTSALMQRSSTPRAQTALKPPQHTGSRPRSSTAAPGRKPGGCHGGRSTSCHPGAGQPPPDSGAPPPSAAQLSPRPKRRPGAPASTEAPPCRPLTAPARPPPRPRHPSPATRAWKRERSGGPDPLPSPLPGSGVPPRTRRGAPITGKPAYRGRAGAWLPGTTPSCHGAGAAP